MATKLENFNQLHLKQNLAEIQPGDTVRVYQKIKEGDKERIQVFEGQVLARKHGQEMGSTITVRKVISGVGVERIFPLHSPLIDKIEIAKKVKVRRAKLYYLRTSQGRKTRLKRKESKESLTAATEEKTEADETQE